MKSGMDTIFKIGFGVELGVLSGLKEANAFSKVFDEASSQIVFRYFDIFWKIKRFLNVGSEAKMKKNIQLIDDFVYEVISKKTKQLTEQGKDTVSVQQLTSPVNYFNIINLLCSFVPFHSCRRTTFCPDFYWKKRKFGFLQK